MFSRLETGLAERTKVHAEGSGNHGIGDLAGRSICAAATIESAYTTLDNYAPAHDVTGACKSGPSACDGCQL
jgi:hypothetical protein